jgi:hypothetical protein
LDPGYSVGVAVVESEGNRLLWATVLRCPPPRNLDDHKATSKSLAGLICELVDIARRWDDGTGIAVGLEGYNTPQTWTKTGTVRGKRGKPLGKVEVAEHLWPRMQISAVSGVFQPCHVIRPGTHEGRRYPTQLTEQGWPKAWVNGRPDGDPRDAQRAYAVALAVPRRVKVPT